MSYFIKNIDWALTNKCNSRCKICDIWQTPTAGLRKELTIKGIAEILKNRLLKESYLFYRKKFDVALGGGEPFMREDFNDIAFLVNKYYPASIGAISTNGLLTKKITGFLENSYNSFRTKLNISIDGDETNHDRQRGIQGAYKKTLETVRLVKKRFPEQKIELKMTLTPTNYTDIMHVYNLAENLGCNFSFKPAEYIENYTNRFKIADFVFRKEQIKIIKEQADDIFLMELKKGRKKEALFYKHIPLYLENRNTRLVKCDIAKNSITIMPDGKVYSCILMESIGNLNERSIDEIWNSEKAELLRKEIEQGKCPNCMLMCGSFESFGKL